MTVRHLAVAVSLLVFLGCERKRLESAAPGQPTMHNLAQRRHLKGVESGKRMEAIRARAKALTDEQAQTLLAQVKTNPGNQDTAAELFQHYEMAGDAASLNALNLWYIEHQPGGPVWTREIDPHLFSKDYAQGRALWLANVKRPHAEPLVFLRAAHFLKAGDRPLSEAVLHAAMKAYPKHSDWTRELGILYAQAPPREGLAELTDAPLLIAIARGSMQMGNVDAARQYIARAERVNPELTAKSGIAAQFKNAEAGKRIRALIKMSPAQKAKLTESDQLLLTVLDMQNAWHTQKSAEAEVQARKAIALAAKLPSDPMHDVVMSEGNIVLGKGAFRRGKHSEAARYLSLAADAPADGLQWAQSSSFSLVSALIDAGYRTEAAEFFDRIAGKTQQPNQYRAWASEIRKGTNPVDLPSSGSMGCEHDPC